MKDRVEALVDELDAAVRNDGILVLAADTRERTLTPLAFRGDPNEQIRARGPLPWSGLTGRAVERRKPMIVNDAHLDPRALVFSDPVIPEAILIFPILVAGELRGCVNLWRDGAGKQFDDTDLESVAPFAQRLGDVL